MDVAQLLERANDGITVKRVFGEPIERDGVTVIPVAIVAGGAGGGGDGSGGGGGFGVHARPAGVYVIRDGNVRFQPTIDLRASILGGLALLWLLRRGRKRRSRAKR